MDFNVVRKLLGLSKRPYTNHVGDGQQRAQERLKIHRRIWADTPKNVKMNWQFHSAHRHALRQERKERKKMWKARAIMMRRKGLA